MPNETQRNFFHSDYTLEYISKNIKRHLPNFENPMKTNLLADVVLYLASESGFSYCLQYNPYTFSDTLAFHYAYLTKDKAISIKDKLNNRFQKQIAEYIFDNGSVVSDAISIKMDAIYNHIIPEIPNFVAAYPKRLEEYTTYTFDNVTYQLQTIADNYFIGIEDSHLLEDAIWNLVAETPERAKTIEDVTDQIKNFPLELNTIIQNYDQAIPFKEEIKREVSHQNSFFAVGKNDTETEFHFTLPLPEKTLVTKYFNNILPKAARLEQKNEEQVVVIKNSALIEPNGYFLNSFSNFLQKTSAENKKTHQYQSGFLNATIEKIAKKIWDLHEAFAELYFPGKYSYQNVADDNFLNPDIEKHIDDLSRKCGNLAIALGFQTPSEEQIDQLFLDRNFSIFENKTSSEKWHNANLWKRIEYLIGDISTSLQDENFLDVHALSKRELAIELKTLTKIQSALNMNFENETARLGI